MQGATGLGLQVGVIEIVVQAGYDPAHEARSFLPAGIRTGFCGGAPPLIVTPMAAIWGGVRYCLCRVKSPGPRWRSAQRSTYPVSPRLHSRDRTNKAPVA
jgi:hypothetical protein